MASLVLGVAGAAIGGILGGPLGASLGWLAGSTLGNVLNPQKIEGPRLTDLRPQSASYGAPIRIVYGIMRTPGVVVWQTDLHEHSHRSGGKGGPEVTSYTYSASFAIELCEGPIIGVRRVWADGRIVRDPSSGSTQTVEYTLYLGTETQGPDPTMEAELGAGNVPGYRGMALAVFTDLDLTAFGNRVPNFEFEVMTSASGRIPYRYSLWPRRTVTSAHLDHWPGVQLENGVLLQAETTEGASGYGAWLYVDSYDLYGNLIASVLDVHMPAIDDAFTSDPAYFPANNNAHILIGTQTDPVGGSPKCRWYVDGVPGPTITSVNPSDPYYAFNDSFVCTEDAAYVLGGNGAAWLAKYPIAGGVPSGTHTAAFSFNATAGTDATVSVGDNGHLYLNLVGTITLPDRLHDLIELDEDLVEVRRWTRGAPVSGVFVNSDYLVDNGLGGVVDLYPGNHVAVQGDRLLTLRLGLTGLIPDNFHIVDITGGTWSRVASNISAAGGDSNALVNLSDGLVSAGGGVVAMTPPPGPVTLASIVADLSERCGLAGLYDVDDLTDLVWGFILDKQMTGRAAIEPLRDAYAFDGVESDGVVKFVKRGAASAFEIPTAELAARVGDDDEILPLSTVRALEESLPRVVRVKYLNTATDYQVDTQYDERQVTNSELEVIIDLPIAMTNAQAKAIASMQVYTAWIERERHTFATARKWSKAEPTDVATIEGRALRLVDKDEGDGVLTFHAVAAGFANFIHSGISAPGKGFVPPTIPTGSTQEAALLLLDLPLIADADAAGFYAAMAGSVDTTWPGAALERSVDGGATYSEIDTETAPDTIGDATTALGDYGGGNTIDDINSVVVVLSTPGATLESVTTDALLSGSNLALIGSEVVGFATATLTAPATYLLTNLLRGRRGTEWAVPAHAAGDRFVLLSGLTNLAQATSEVGVTRDYKAVTSGATLASATKQQLTLRGAAWRPYAPVLLGGGVVAGGDVNLVWTRRTRVGGGWRGPSYVPLSESTEEYVVQIWDATYTQCVRIMTSTSIGLPLTGLSVYSAANQVTDFGALQQHIYFSVAQRGSVGIGYEAHGVAGGGGGSDSAPLATITPYGYAAPYTAACALPVPLTTALAGPTSSATFAAWHAGEIWALHFTTGADGTHGSIIVREASGVPVTRSGVLSASLCGSPVGPGCSLEGATLGFFFWVGSGNPFPRQWPTLAPSTTYHLELRTAAASPATATYTTT